MPPPEVVTVTGKSTGPRGRPGQPSSSEREQQRPRPAAGGRGAVGTLVTHGQRRVIQRPSHCHRWDRGAPGS